MNSVISELRMDKGLTRREVAGAMGLSHREYELYELGLVDIPEDLEARIKSYLNQFGA
jgi:transcriptional regulator with XRE-family HTH domain